MTRASDGRGTPRAVPRTAVIALAIAGLAILGIAVALGYSTSQQLVTQQAALAARQATLASVKSDAAVAQGSLDQAKKTHSSLDEDVAGLKTKVDGQTACIRAQQANLTELDRISGLLTDNFNRTSEKSEFEKAAETRADALGDALNAYYQAALAKARGDTATANSWLTKAIAYEKKADEKGAFQNSELKAVDASAKDIEAALTALEGQLDQTATTCGLGS